MPEIWMDVDAALAEVPVNLMPLIDSTDFKTVEDAVAFNAAGMDLRWNFVTTAGAYTSVAVTPTSGSNHDWAHKGDGMYAIEIPASGGSVNNDTEGFGWFSGKIDGVLPFRGPMIGLRASGLNDLLIDNAYSATRGLAGTALPNAAAAASGGLATVDGSNRVAGIQGTITTLDALDTAQDSQHATTQGRLPAALVGGKIDANVGTVTDGAITANAIASGAIDADALDPTAIAEIADGVLDEAITEPGGVFAWAGGSLRSIVGLLGALGRNKITQTASVFALRNDADAGNIATAGVTDDSTTFTRAKLT